MRVLMVTPWFPSPESPIRGIWTIPLAKALAVDHQVALLAYSPRLRASAPFELSDEVENGLRTLRLSYPPPRLPGLGLVAARAGTRRALDELAAEGFAPEVIHAHVFLSAPAALTAKRRSRTPLIVHEHLTRLTEGQLSRAERALARVAYGSADLVCTIAARMVGPVSRLGARRTTHTWNLVDTELFRAPAKRHGDGEIHAIAAGSLNEKKGHRHLLHALAAARRSEPRLRLELVGDGELRPSLERQVEALGIAEIVTFHGYLDPPDLAALMRRCDLHVLPSERENQPHVLIEAMASGLPTVATDVGGVPEMLDGAGALVPKEAPEALARAMVEICARLDRFDRAAIARRAEERHSPEAIRRQWGGIYRRVRSEAAP